MKNTTAELEHTERLAEFYRFEAFCLRQVGEVDDAKLYEQTADRLKPLVASLRTRVLSGK